MRYDLKAKAILKANDIPLIRYNKNVKAPRIIQDGVEIIQVYGELIITLNGYNLEKVNDLLKDLDCEKVFYK